MQSPVTIIDFLYDSRKILSEKSYKEFREQSKELFLMT